MRSSLFLLWTACVGKETTPDSADCTESEGWYADADGDGFGDPSTEVVDCETQPTVRDATDCDDGRADVYPGATEVCDDGVVNDCDDDDGASAWSSCPAAGPFSLDDADAKLLGESREDYAGSSVAFAGDVDGDGKDDMLVAADNREPNVVYLVHGSVSGTFDLGRSDARMIGETYDGAGSSVSSAGDLDLDGADDILVGAIFGSVDGLESGVVYIVNGPVSGDLLLSDADATLAGEHESDWVGDAVANPGDVNGDGWEDVLVGAHNVEGPDIESGLGGCADTDTEQPYDRGGGAGRAYLVLGPIDADRGLSTADATWTGEDGGDSAGDTVTGAGDQDGDGLPDLFIGARGNCEAGEHGGAAYVVSGVDAGDLYLVDADAKLIAESAGDRAGEAIAGAGDMNGDGYTDLVVGAPYASGSAGILQGCAYLVHGPVFGRKNLSTANAILHGEDVSDRAGSSVALAGDIDEDGLDDILIGAAHESSDGDFAGAAYLVSGALSGSNTLSQASAKFAGSVANASAGAAAAGSGDVDADGRLDLLIGAHYDSDGGDEAGAAYLLLGSGLLSEVSGGP